AVVRCTYDSRAVLSRMGLRFLVALLHLLQPAARLYGRLSCGLTLWRRRGPFVPAFPATRTFRIWSEQWRGTSDRLRSIESKLRAEGPCGVPGRGFGGW